jgi:acetylornithine deacetylase/succinyl-diaminopimelate desuccinylase-like protein
VADDAPDVSDSATVFEPKSIRDAALAEAKGHAADECLRLNDLRRATATVACAIPEILA